MKKRLFITSALMTAVMAASLATGTYAWYQATGTGGINATSTSQTVTTVDPGIKMNGVAVTASLTPVSTDKLHLAEVNTEKTAYVTKYLNAKNEEVVYSLPEKAVAAKAYVLSIKIPDKTNSQLFDQHRAELAGVTLSISVTRSDGSFDISEGKKLPAADSRTVVWVTNTVTAETKKDNVVYKSGTDTATTTFTFDNTYTNIQETYEIAVVYVYVDGNNEQSGQNVKDEGEVCANFVVNIASSANS